MSERIKNINERILHDQWATLKSVSFDYKNADDRWTSVKREVFDRGDGASVLLYNNNKKTVILVRQFRLPAFLNGDSGFLLETCAGMIEGQTPEKTVMREVLEETGYEIEILEKVADVFMSPGASTERIHLYIAPYDESQKVGAGGGLETEDEDIEVVEYAFAKALEDLSKGMIRDAKTVILLQHLALSGIME